MVPADVNHFVYEQDRRLQEEAFKGPPRTLLLRVHWWYRHQQGREVHSMAVHAGEPGTSECLPTVSVLFVELSRRSIQILS